MPVIRPRAGVRSRQQWPSPLSRPPGLLHPAQRASVPRPRRWAKTCGEGERARCRALRRDSPSEPPPAPCPGPAAESHASPGLPPAVTPEKSGTAELSPSGTERRLTLLRAAARKVAGGGPRPRAALNPAGPRASEGRGRGGPAHPRRGPHRPAPEAGEEPGPGCAAAMAGRAPTAARARLSPRGLSRRWAGRPPLPLGSTATSWPPAAGTGWAESPRPERRPAQPARPPVPAERQGAAGAGAAEGAKAKRRPRGAGECRHGRAVPRRALLTPWLFDPANSCY